MYSNGKYKVYTNRNLVGPDWVCELTVDNFTVKSEGCYTRWGAMHQANRLMDKKRKLWFKLKDNRDVLEDILADTVVAEFISTICGKVDPAKHICTPDYQNGCCSKCGAPAGGDDD